jgi:hypothetical protein
VAFNGLTDVLLGLFNGVTGGDTAREVGDVSGPVMFAFFKNDRIAGFIVSSPAALRIAGTLHLR